MIRTSTILIVEDEAVVRDLMVRVLVREDYRVLETGSAAEGLAVSQEFNGPIDLLVADHTLKTMTGRQLAEKICHSRPSLKVLHTSGYPFERLEEEGGFMAGADFLGKPFLPKALIEKVREILTRRNAAAAT